ncbi:hypothetical protein RDWZM_005437 [Blomia tropicalis]|uniref:CWH43-like N-terminal domain-containing protein n=1 Tax=Blomia tropicalis TaxID=40697 RepID=A0A9Q0RMM0_BLOTA|nr:hypothetical protein RDWZM_005437 [Blomia tropicalis]
MSNLDDEYEEENENYKTTSFTCDLQCILNNSVILRRNPVETNVTYFIDDLGKIEIAFKIFFNNNYNQSLLEKRKLMLKKNSKEVLQSSLSISDSFEVVTFSNKVPSAFKKCLKSDKKTVKFIETTPTPKDFNKISAPCKLFTEQLKEQKLENKVEVSNTIFNNDTSLINQLYVQKNISPIPDYESNVSVLKYMLNEHEKNFLTKTQIRSTPARKAKTIAIQNLKKTAALEEDEKFDRKKIKHIDVKEKKIKQEVPLMSIFVLFVALYLNQLEIWFPYVSDAGTLQPQAGFFSMFMDIIAFLVILTGYIRYRQVKYYLDTIARATQIELRSLLRLYHLNLYSMLCLYPCSIGLMLIGNFRTSEIPILHLIGNVLVLGLIVSVLFQILLCRHLWSSMRIESCPTTMSVMLLIGLLTTLLTFIFTYTSFFLAGLNNAFDFNWGLHWTYDKPGYLWHILATITEWFAVAISIPFYFLSTEFELTNMAERMQQMGTFLQSLQTRIDNTKSEDGSKQKLIDDILKKLQDIDEIENEIRQTLEEGTVTTEDRLDMELNLYNCATFRDLARSVYEQIQQ